MYVSHVVGANLVGDAAELDRIVGVGRPRATEALERPGHTASVLRQWAERQRLVDQLGLSFVLDAWWQRVGQEPTRVARIAVAQSGKLSPTPGAPVTPMPAGFRRGRCDQNDVRWAVSCTICATTSRGSRPTA